MGLGGVCVCEWGGGVCIATGYPRLLVHDMFTLIKNTKTVFRKRLSAGDCSLQERVGL
jgi:hypothetical protein